MGDFMRRVSLFSFKSKQKEKRRNFIQNGGELLQEFLSFSKGGEGSYEDHGLPICTFTAQELIKATGNFSQVVVESEFTMYKGEIGSGRKVLVSKYAGGSHWPRNDVARNIVIGSQMSHHKSVLKVIGCCLEFERPVAVYEYVGDKGILLSDLLLSGRQQRVEGEAHKSCDLRSRVKIASNIASTLVYLHSAFSTPVIYRDLKPSKVIIQEDYSVSGGVAKLFDFTLCVPLPPGELRVEEEFLFGTLGFIDPEYCISGFLTQKSDVYSFGMFLLVLITGKKPLEEVPNPYDDPLQDSVYFADHAKQCVENGEYNKLIDPILLLQEGGGVGGEDQDLVRSLVDLAVMCTRHSGDDRPEMIDAARQLRLMERATRKS